MANKITMKCESCGGTLDINEDQEVLFCPYCGAKELIESSDAVKIEKVKANVSKHKADNDYNLALKKAEMEEERKAVRNINFMNVVLLAFLVIMLLIFRYMAKS